MFVDFHDGCFVTTSVTVVGCREDSHNIALLTPVIPIHHQLMSPCNQFEVVRMVELLRDVLSKSISCASRGDAPATSIIRVRPQQVAHWTLVRYFLNSIQLLNLIESVDARRKSTVKTEDLFLYNSCDRQIVKQVCELLPYVGITILS